MSNAGVLVRAPHAAILAAVAELTQDRAWVEPGARTVRSWPRSASDVLESRVGVAGLVVLASAALALAIVDERFRLLLVPPVALAGLWAVGRFPFAATCAVIALAATILEPAKLKIPVGPLDLRLLEVVLGALLLVAAFFPRRRWWGGLPGVALAVFFAVLILSTVLAVSSGRSHPIDAYHYTRALAPTLLFFVVVRLIPEREDIWRLLRIAAVMAAVSGAVSVLVAVPGSPVGEMLAPNDMPLSDRPPPSETDGMGLINRVRLPGVAIAYVLFWYAALKMLRAERRERALWAAVVAGMAIALALSLNRNMWLGITIGGFLVFALTHTRVRRQFAVGALVLLVIGTLVGLSGAQIRRDSPLYPVVVRATSLFQPEQEIRDSSLTDRFYENRYAVETITANPYLGVGPGAPYGLVDTVNYGNRVFVRETPRFLHNQYFHLLLIAGPLALLSFLVFLIAPAARVLRSAQSAPVMALSIGVALTLLSSLVMISFVDATWGVVLGMLIGSLTILTSPPDRRRVPHGG